MIRIVKLSFKEAHVNDFKQLFETRKIRIKNTEGCLHLELWQDVEQPTIFYTYSIWAEEISLENYRLSALFQDTWATVKLWFDEKPFAFSANKTMDV